MTKGILSAANPLVDNNSAGQPAQPEIKMTIEEYKLKRRNLKLAEHHGLITKDQWYEMLAVLQHRYLSFKP